MDIREIEGILRALGAISGSRFLDWRPVRVGLAGHVETLPSSRELSVKVARR